MRIDFSELKEMLTEIDKVVQKYNARIILPSVSDLNINIKRENLTDMILKIYFLNDKKKS